AAGDERQRDYGERPPRGRRRVVANESGHVLSSRRGRGADFCVILDACTGTARVVAWLLTRVDPSARGVVRPRATVAGRLGAIAPCCVAPLLRARVLRARFLRAPVPRAP